MTTRHKKTTSVITIIILILATVILISQKTKDKETSPLEKQQQLYRQISPKQKNTDNKEKDKLAEARKINSQVVAWLSIPDTDIDFPVVQCEDNSFYLNHDLKKEYNYLGVPFLDYRNNAEFQDFNSVIYGHNMNNQYIFADLLKFKNEAFFKSHTNGELITSDKVYRINFICCDEVENDSFAYDVVFLSEKEQKEYLCNLREKAICITEFSEEKLLKKHLLTISTCSSESATGRIILVGTLEGKEENN